jgi:ABC-type phosphate transport system substrate-binding protein
MSLVHKTLLFGAAWALAAVCGAEAEPAYRLVVNSANPASGLPRSEVARLFLKKVTAWPDGRPVAVIDQERGSPQRQAFSRDIHQKDADAIASYWQTAVFSGRDVPPPIGKSDAEVLAFVRADPGAIGYVSGTADVQGVKVLGLR